MADDVNTLHAAVTGITLAATTFMGFIGRRFITKVDETADALALHEKEDIGKYATADQLTRVHSRIDENTRAVEDNFKETRQGISEIKSLLIQARNHQQ